MEIERMSSRTVWRRSRSATAVISLCVAAGITANAATIIDNGPPDQLHGSAMTHWMQAEAVTLGTSARLESVRFWSFEFPGGFAGSIEWQLYANGENNSPGALLYRSTATNVSHTATGFALGGSIPEFVCTFDITPISLKAGTYWLALHNGPLNNDPGRDRDGFFWEATASPGAIPSNGLEAPYNGSWFAHIFTGYPSKLAFQLMGVIAPRITAIASTGEPRGIEFTTTSGYNYRVAYKNALTDPAWTPVSGLEAVPGTGGIVQIIDPDPNVAARNSRYYKVTLSYDAAAVPRIASFTLENGYPRLSFTTASGYYYRVEYTNNPAIPSWAPVEGAGTISGTGNVVQISDPDLAVATQPRRVYRVLLF